MSPGSVGVLTAFLAAAAVLALGTVAAGGAESQSLLVNGGFEEGQGDTPAGWTLQMWPNPEANPLRGALARTDAKARTGAWALRIDTGPCRGGAGTLVFNGAVSRDALKLRGKQVDLSGWVYVDPARALRPFRVALRVWGKDAQGQTTLVATPFNTPVLGRPGQWVRFHASGMVPDAEITSMDLHCGIQPDVVQTVQYLDDLRLEAHAAAPLEIRALPEAVWRDAPQTAADVRLAAGAGGQGVLVLKLLDARGEAVAKWVRPAASGVVGLALPKQRLPEGAYTLRADVLGATGDPLTASVPVELAASPWEDMAEACPVNPKPLAAAPVPEGFEAMGTVAPAAVQDAEAAGVGGSPDAAPAPAADDRGYVIFSRHHLEGVSVADRPRPGETDGIRLFGCAGQYLPAAVSVWARKPLSKVRVTVGDLFSGRGGIARANIDVRAVRTPRGLPAFLEKRPAVDIPAGRTQAFWLTVYVPPGTAPGLYSGDVAVAPDGGEPTRMRLLVRVLPLALPAAAKGYGFWWNMDARWEGYYTKDRATALQQMRKQFALLREHGCNMVSIYGMPKMRWDEDGTVAFDFGRDHWGHCAFSPNDLARVARETRLFAAGRPVQYPGAELLHTDWVAKELGLDPKSAAFETFYQHACERINRWAKRQGINLAFACVDEIGNSGERVETALRFYPLVHEAEALAAVTDNSMHGGVHLSAQERFEGMFDLLLYNLIMPEMVERGRAAGSAVWLYNLGSQEDLRQNRFVFGLFAERCGADGVGQWAFQWPDGSADPYKTAAAGKGAGHHFALPAPDGPLPTLALEAIRDGIDDARYVALVRQTAPASPMPVLDEIDPYSTSIPDFLESHGGNSFDVRRWKLARAAMKK